MDERSWQMGRKSAYTALLRQCLRELGADRDDPEQELAMRVVERQETVVALRELCEDFGDNDWPDELHLGDVIEKHLARPLYRNVSTALEEVESEPWLHMGDFRIPSGEFLLWPFIIPDDWKPGDRIAIRLGIEGLHLVKLEDGEGVEVLLPLQRSVKV